jgi:hypothetical protein
MEQEIKEEEITIVITILVLKCNLEITTKEIISLVLLKTKTTGVNSQTIKISNNQDTLTTIILISRTIPIIHDFSLWLKGQKSLTK